MKPSLETSIGTLVIFGTTAFAFSCLSLHLDFLCSGSGNRYLQIGAIMVLLLTRPLLHESPAAKLAITVTALGGFAVMFGTNQMEMADRNNADWAALTKFVLFGVLALWLPRHRDNRHPIANDDKARHRWADQALVELQAMTAFSRRRLSNRSTSERRDVRK